MNRADGDPSEYVYLKGLDFYPDSSMLSYLMPYNGKTVYLVFENDFWSQSDASAPAEENYLVTGVPLYVIE